MHLCSYQFEGQTHVGLVHGSGIVNLSRALGDALSAHQPMLDLIAHWPELQDRVLALRDAPADTTLEQVRLLAPVPKPGKLMAIGLNYLDHVQETIVGETRTVPEHPVWFPKLSSAVNGPFDDIVLPRVSNMTDYEGELVAIIGQRCRHVSPQQASEVIFGYCVGNDVSVRDFQKRTSQWMLGKSFDTHAPFGPWITTADELGDPHTLGLRCWVNGELRQSSNTRLMIHNIWAQIAQLSEVMTLEPGDVVFTGTCSGVGAASTPPRFLKHGDTVRVEIERLGAIVAKCRDEAA